MGDNDLRKQAQQAAAQAAAIRNAQQQNASVNLQQNISANLRSSVPSNFGFNGVVNLRGSRPLSEGADLTDGINFAVDDGEVL